MGKIIEFLSQTPTEFRSKNSASKSKELTGTLKKSKCILLKFYLTTEQEKQGLLNKKKTRICGENIDLRKT